VPVGLHTLVARTALRAFALVVAVEEGRDTSVGDIVLREAGQISGLVTSAETREPVAGALVTVTEIVLDNTADQMPHPVRIDHTDATGSYTVSGLPVGDYLVSISADGFETASLKLSVTAGHTTTGDVALTPGKPTEKGSMEGTVYLATPDGQQIPLEGVLVRLARPEDPFPMRPMPAEALDANGSPVSIYPGARSMMPFDEIYTFTDKEGKYRLEGVPIGDYIAVAVRPGLEPDHKKVTITANEVTKLDFTLTLREPEVGIIEGTVVNASDNKPIAGASVYAIFYGPMPMAEGGGHGARSDEGSGEGGSGSTSSGVVITPDDYMLYTRTDENGHYRLLAPEAVTSIGVYAEGFEPQEVPVKVIGGGTTTVDVKLNPVIIKEVVLSGKVTTLNEPNETVPVKGATVYASPYSDDPRMGMPAVLFSAETDQEGSYRLPLQAGVYFVYAIKDNLRSEAIPLKIFEDTAWDFVLKEDTTISPPSMGHHK